MSGALASVRTPLIRMLLVLVGVPVIITAAVAALFYQGIVRCNYPDLAEYPVQGVDVSHHQGRIDWRNLQGMKAQFAYIKASEGAGYRDPRFSENWSAATTAGAIPGAYHFFSLCKAGDEQAANFIEATADATGPSLPPVVDLEFGGNCDARPMPEQFAIQLRNFLKAVEAKRGCSPILYFTQEFYGPYIAGRFAASRLWVRDIYRRPALPGGAPWVLWQFANRGRLAGIDGFIDMNVFNGSREAFARFRCEATAH